MDALLVIGGNGSQAGAYELSRIDFPLVGGALTIDNDLYGADIEAKRTENRTQFVT